MPLARSRATTPAPLLTLAGVAVAAENIETVRRLILAGFDGAPLKWRDGWLRGLGVVARIIQSQTLPVAITHMTEISAEAWQ
jgi:hypothetical protein